LCRAAQGNLLFWFLSSLSRASTDGIRYDYKTGAISDDVAEQAEQCMQNIAGALAEAGAEMGDVVRVRYILPDRKDFEKTW
jgi:enamine deaminase RidA (YjgF/YER057c/UK114 family)